MKIKGIKRGQFIELLEETSLEDGTQIAVEISDLPHHLRKESDLTQLWNRDRQQATINLLKSWEAGDSQEQKETFSALKNLDNERNRKLFTETDYSS